MEIYAKFDVGREEVDAMVPEQQALGDDTLLAIQSAQNGIRELGTGVSHREGRVSGVIFCLDDFVSTKLSAVNELFVSLALGPLVMYTL